MVTPVVTLLPDPTLAQLVLVVMLVRPARLEPQEPRLARKEQAQPDVPPAPLEVNLEQAVPPAPAAALLAALPLLELLVTPSPMLSQQARAALDSAPLFFPVPLVQATS